MGGLGGGSERGPVHAPALQRLLSSHRSVRDTDPPLTPQGTQGWEGVAGAQSRRQTQPGVREDFPEEGEKDKEQFDKKSTGRAVLISRV